MVFQVFIDLLKYPIYAITFLLAIFCVSFTFFFCINLLKGKRLKKGEHYKIEKPSLLKRLFVLMPKQYVSDIFDKDPEFFKYQGLVIFEGRQGAGKTISMVKFIMDMQQEYPLAKCITNLAYSKEDKELKTWHMLMGYKNGKRGVIVGMDELQNWFSSNDSKNFPPEMLSVITQNRKNRRIILGTSQNFYLLAKAIRSQTTEVRRCTTLLGCLTIVRKFLPILDSEGNVVEWKNRGMYCFVHNKELRDSYDTWKVIEKLKDSGFKETTTTEVTSNTYIIGSSKKK